MAEHVRWYAVPVALAVFLGVAALSDAGAPQLSEAEPPRAGVPVDAAWRAETKPGAGAPTATTGELTLRFPPAWCGERIELTVWRRTASGREATPWLFVRPRVRDDASIPFAGLPRGSYDLEARRAGDVRAVESAVVPGTADFAAASPAPR